MRIDLTGDATVKRGPGKRDRAEILHDLFTATGIVSASSLAGQPPSRSPLDIKADRRRAAKDQAPTDTIAADYDGVEPAGWLAKPEKELHLRDYQKDAEDSIFREWQDNRSTMAIMATGTGKTVVSSRVCQRILDGELGQLGRRFLFLAHREELITQTFDTFRSAFPRHRVEIERAGDRASRLADIVIASNQTLGRRDRLDRWQPDWFACICQDEAHHCIASNATYNGIIRHFPRAKLLGLTATPDRQDEIALGQIFDSVAFTFDIVDGVREGWLVPVGQKLEIVQDIDYSTIKLDKSGEFTDEDLARVMREEKNLYALADAAIKYSNFGGKQRSTLVFAASREHAIDVADILNAKHATKGTGRAACIHYKLEADRRKEIIAAYKRQEIRYLTNFGILVEGFDDDETRIIVNGRPIHKNRALFAQLVGRATRPLKEILAALAAAPDAAARKAIIKASRKPGAMVVDLCGVNHKLVLNMTDLLGGHYTEEAVAIVRERIAKSADVVDVESELEAIQRKIDEQKAEERRKKLRESVNFDVKLVGRTVDPFNLSDGVAPRGVSAPMSNAATKPQLEMLERYGVPKNEIKELTKSAARKLIDTIQVRRRMGLCTYKQANKLAQYGYDPNMTFDNARKILDALAANGWRPIELDRNNPNL